MPRGKIKNGNGKRLATPQSVDQAVKSICDIMRRGNCAGAMQYVPELTWILFLRILVEKNSTKNSRKQRALGVPFRPLLIRPSVGEIGALRRKPCLKGKRISVSSSRTRRRMPFFPLSTVSCFLT